MDRATTTPPRPARAEAAHTLAQARDLVLLTLALALVLWLLRPDRLPLAADPEVYALDLPVPLISVPQALDLYEEGFHHFIDTRRGPARGRPTIPGAFVVREAEFAEDLEAAMAFVYPEDHLILFGESSPLAVTPVAVRFLDRGYRNVRILQGGLPAWRQAGGPLDDGEAADE
jgi:rhodanese-related sulfurtransferase